MPIEIPPALAETQREGGGAWVRDLPALVERILSQWSLHLDGPPAHGMAGLVLPVLRDDDTPAVLKLQPTTADNAATAIGLRTWAGEGAVLLLDHDEPTGAMLLERLDAARPLALAPWPEAVEILAGLLARLTTVQAPPGVRTLATVATAMLDHTPRAVAQLDDPADQRLVLNCAAAVAELAGEAGDRLLHWDLHYDNVLAGDREPWLAIDPEPLAGDPGFDLLPALDNRWQEAVATGDVSKAVRHRFDLLTERLGLERDRATGWTLGRVLQNTLWDVEDGKTTVDPVQAAIATALTHR